MVFLLLTLLPMAEPTANWAPPPTESERSAAAALSDAATPEEIRQVAAEQLDALGESNPSASVLREAASSGEQADAQRAAESLTFRPRAEAPLAAGYPNPTRLHAIEVKKLPAYRQARVAMQAEQPAAGDQSSVLMRGGESNQAFWNLFGHIQRNQIAMTAPVRTQYEVEGSDSERPTMQPRSMAFLYGEPDWGQAGADPQNANVEVVDVPARLVVSTAVRSDAADDIAGARERLIAWLDGQSEYVRDGDLEILGYNGPMTPPNERLVEVQIPVRKAEG